MNRDHSVAFEIALKYCISESLVDYEGYSFSAKEFLPTVVEVVVIWIKFTHSGPFLFADSQNVNVHSCHLLFQFSSVSQSSLTLCDPMNCSTPGLPVHHQLLEFTQTHVHWVGNAIQQPNPLSSPSPPTFNLSHTSRYNGHVSEIHPFQSILVRWFLKCRCSLLPSPVWLLPICLDSGPNIPGSYAILLFTASDFTSITSPIHNWVLFLLWLCPFILSGGISWLPTFAFQPPEWKGHLLGVLVLEGLIGLHRTVQLQLLQDYWSGHKLGLLW